MFTSREKGLLSARRSVNNRLVRYQNVLRKVEEIGAEILQDYQSDDSVRVKRLAKEPGKLPEAKKEPKV